MPGTKQKLDTGPIYFILCIIFGLFVRYGPNYGYMWSFEYFSITHRHVGFVLVVIGAICLFFNVTRKKKERISCSKCGWTGPPRRWEEVGGCPICIAKNRKAMQDEIDELLK